MCLCLISLMTFPFAMPRRMVSGDTLTMPCPAYVCTNVCVCVVTALPKEKSSSQSPEPEGSGIDR